MTDDLVKRLRVPNPCCEEHHTQNEAADRIEALERERDNAVINRAAWELAAREAALDALAAAGQAQEAYEAQLKAEAERDEAKAMQECGCAYENPTDICAGHHALFERVYGVQRAALEARLDATKDKAEAVIIDLMSKLGKAVEVLRALSCKCQSNCDWERDDVCTSWTARAVLAEIEGGKDE
jgi:hypothetical protein